MKQELLPVLVVCEGRDIMYLNTDRPGQVSQAKNLLGHIRPEPSHPLYAKQCA